MEASQAGVPIDLFVRGISCILPGVEGYTDRVREVSIVGQLLEHSRIYGFGPRDDCKLYLSSADLMTRNMDKRIEIAWPILNDTLRNQVLGYLGICYSDTAKLRELLPDGSYTALGAFAERDENGEVELFDSQKYLIAEAQRMKLVSAELAARQEANNGGSARMVFPLGEVATAGSAPAGADEVVTEEESEFIAHRSPELEAAEAKAVRDAADAMAAAATATAASVLEAVTKAWPRRWPPCRPVRPKGRRRPRKMPLPPVLIQLRPIRPRRLIRLRQPRPPRAPWPNARSWMPRRQRPWKRGARGPIPRRPLLR